MQFFEISLRTEFPGKLFDGEKQLLDFLYVRCPKLCWLDPQYGAEKSASKQQEIGSDSVAANGCSPHYQSQSAMTNDENTWPELKATSEENRKENSA
ncbi:hypothetical protein D918_07567 [Trichuris suis]|nr:hypothetical protein D918_07567 [Trichuris suis]